MSNPIFTDAFVEKYVEGKLAFPSKGYAILGEGATKVGRKAHPSDVAVSSPIGIKHPVRIDLSKIERKGSQLSFNYGIATDDPIVFEVPAKVDEIIFVDEDDTPILTTVFRPITLLARDQLTFNYSLDDEGARGWFTMLARRFFGKVA